MKLKKKILSLAILFVFVLSMVPLMNRTEARAITETDPVLSAPTATAAQMKQWAVDLNKPDFGDFAQMFYDISVERGVNPVIPYALSAWKTGYFGFTGTVQREWNNPAGIQEADGTFSQFATWEDGIAAFVDHLALLAGAEGYPLATTTDPNHDASLLGIAPTVADLATALGDANYTSQVVSKSPVMEAKVVTEPTPTETTTEPSTEPTTTEPAPETTGTPILSSSTTSIAQMRQFVQDNNGNALLEEVAPLFVEIGLKAGVDPAIPFVQMVWQSGWGNYAGTVKADWHNPAGLKDEAGNLLQFASWEEGITAHIDHLALLAGADTYPLTDSPDPIHNPDLLGTAVNVEDLEQAYGDALWTSKTLELLEKLHATVTEASPVDDGTVIMGPPTTTVEDMMKWAESRNADPLFVELAQVFYDVSVEVGVDPAVTYTQSAKETNFMHFTGVLDASFKNPCGLKTSGGGGDYDPDAHTRFDSWEQGIRAQVDHLALYAGAEGYPDPNSPDPRHFPSIYGVAPTVEELGGRWAPSPTYGTEIVDMMKQLYSVNDPDYSVGGNEEGQAILNEATGTVEQMRIWAEQNNADPEFIEQAQNFYDISVSKGVDPILTYAQAAIATDFFHFTNSTIDKSFYSTANIKTSVAGPDEDPNSFQRFASWEEGILAHVDHLALYAGAEGYPDANSPDPRHFPSIRGLATTVESLSGRWSPDTDYGNNILAYMQEIWAIEVEVPTETTTEEVTEPTTVEETTVDDSNETTTEVTTEAIESDDDSTETTVIPEEASTDSSDAKDDEVVKTGERQTNIYTGVGMLVLAIAISSILIALKKRNKTY